VKLRELTLLLSIRNRFQSHWNGSETVIPVSRFKSVSPQLKPLIDRKIETYIKKFQSSEGPGVAPEVSPPDETALARQFFSPSSEGVRTSQLGPEMTEPTKTEDRRGMKLPQLAFIYRQIILPSFFASCDRAASHSFRSPAVRDTIPDPSALRYIRSREDRYDASGNAYVACHL